MPALPDKVEIRKNALRVDSRAKLSLPIKNSKSGRYE